MKSSKNLTEKIKKFITRIPVLPLLLAAITVTFEPARAVPPQSDSPLTNLEYAAAKKVRSVFSKHVFKLDRQMYTFHYQSDENGMAWKPKDQQELVQASEYWGQDFFDMDVVSSDMMGPGHYVAIDPVGSRSFGGKKDPQLYITVLKPNIVVLNGNSDLSDDEFSLLNELAKKMKCDEEATLESELEDKINRPHNTGNYSRAMPESDYISDWVSYFRASKNLSCRKIIIHAFEELEIKAILYSYSAAKQLAHCRDNRGEALSIISSTAFDTDKLSYFSNNIRMDPEQIGGSIKMLYSEGSNDTDLNSQGRLEDPPRSLKYTEDVIQSQYTNWKKNNIFKCGSTWKTENPKMDVANAIFMKAADPDIKNLMAKTQKAYALRVGDERFESNPPSSYWSLESLSGYLNKNFMVINKMYPQLTYDQYLQILKISHGKERSSERDNLIARILGEDPRRIDHKFLVSKKAVFAVSKTFVVFKKNPKPLFSLYKKIGFGPRHTIFLYNQMAANLSLAPILTGKYTNAQTFDFSRSFAESKAILMELLNRCYDEYQDKHLPFEKINSGVCGQVTWSSSGSPANDIKSNDIKTD